MTPQEMWNAYKQINPSIGDEIDAWAFGVDPDLLAELVFKGEKTATASAYDLYALEDEPLPQEGTFDVILDSQNQAVCIVEITKVSVQPFPSGFSRPCLQGRRRRQITGLLASGS